HDTNSAQSHGPLKFGSRNFARAPSTYFSPTCFWAKAITSSANAIFPTTRFNGLATAWALARLAVGFHARAGVGAGNERRVHASGVDGPAHARLRVVFLASLRGLGRRRVPRWCALTVGRRAVGRGPGHANPVLFDGALAAHQRTNAALPALKALQDRRRWPV